MKMPEKDWWKSAVVYQIYPQSFKDTNGDGFGDLNGVIQKLDYIKSLGANVIWLCPVYVSPRVDNGYDIADYKRIDPAYGTNEDMWRLIEEADRRGIKILMDLVINHSSDKHPWFQAALADPNSKYADYYIFRQGKNGKAPNNLRDYFATPAWTQVGDTDRWYFHAFAPEQPDLNWENPALRAEIVEMVNWWLDHGLGGFRLDAVCNLKKSPEALAQKQFEPDAADGLHNCWRYIFDQPGCEAFLAELAEKCFRPHNAMTVGEATIPAERLGLYTGENGVFSMLFDFSYVEIDLKDVTPYGKPNFTTADFRRALFQNQLDTQRVGWTAPCLENHDQPRSLGKFIPQKDIGPKAAKMLATVFLPLRGTPFIYQGQELGMPNCPFALEEYRDMCVPAQYKNGLEIGLSKAEMLDFFARRGRDNARTPMPWDDSPNAGFSAAQPWIKVNPAYQDGVNVAAEEADPESVLHYYRALVALRRQGPWADVLTEGSFAPVETVDGDVIAYLRQQGDKTLCIVCNFTAAPGRAQLPAPVKGTLLTNAQTPAPAGETALQLAPYDAFALELQM